jgi:hypothetical protein
LTKARRATRAEWLGRARIFQIYVEVVHVPQCLVVSTIIPSSEHVWHNSGKLQKIFWLSGGPVWKTV